MATPILHTNDQIGGEIRCLRTKEDNELVVAYNRVLQKSEKRVKKAATDPDDLSVRLINNKRYEVFIISRDYPDTFFQKISNDITKLAPFQGRNVAKELLDFCRIQSNYEHMKFDNLSFIVTYGPVSQQLPHIDVVDPNEMFSLIMDPKTPATIFYPIERKFVIQSFSSLFKLWSQKFGTVPDAIVESMRVSKNARYNLERFGNVFAMDLKAHSFSDCPAGTVITCKAGIVHAGPHIRQRFRAAIFGSVSPGDRAVLPYDPDVQCNACSLLCVMMFDVWHRKHMVLQARKYLLDVFLFYASREDSDPAQSVSEYPLMASLIHDMYANKAYDPGAVEDDWLFDRFLPVDDDWLEEYQIEEFDLVKEDKRLKVKVSLSDLSLSITNEKGKAIYGGLWDSTDRTIFLCNYRSWSVYKTPGYKSWEGPFVLQPISYASPEKARTRNIADTEVAASDDTASMSSGVMEPAEKKMKVQTELVDNTQRPQQDL